MYRLVEVGVVSLKISFLFLIMLKKKEYLILIYIFNLRLI